MFYDAFMKEVNISPGNSSASFSGSILGSYWESSPSCESAEEKCELTLTLGKLVRALLYCKASSHVLLEGHFSFWNKAHILYDVISLQTHNTPLGRIWNSSLSCPMCLRALLFTTLILFFMGFSPHCAKSNFVVTFSGHQPFICPCRATNLCWLCP